MIDTNSTVSLNVDSVINLEEESKEPVSKLPPHLVARINKAEQSQIGGNRDPGSDVMSLMGQNALVTT